MFTPTFTITSKLLGSIKRITEVITLLNERRFPHVVLLDLERDAREISAFTSTSIEGNPLPLTDVKRILKHTPAHIRDTEREVLNYNSALLYLNTHVTTQNPKTLDMDLLLRVHSMIMDGLLPKMCIGSFRTDPVFVNDPRRRETVYWPPDQQDVKKLMTELMNFIKQNAQTLDPLIMAGIFHKQFILVHPFMDGNGRTARLATKVLLAALGINTFNLFSFERYYNNNVTKYFDMVGERGNYYDLLVDLTVWLEYFTDGILDELLRVQKELERLNVSPASGITVHHKKILDYVQQHGVITAAAYATISSRAKATRANDLRYLVENGLLESQGNGRATFYTLKK